MRFMARMRVQGQVSLGWTGLGVVMSALGVVLWARQAASGAGASAPRTQPTFQQVVLDDSYIAYEREVGDIDGDGRNDVVAVMEGDTTIQVFRAPAWKRSTLVLFTGEHRYPRADDFKLVDVDGDGDLDVVTRLGQGPSDDGAGLAVWCENLGGGSKFTQHLIGASREYVKDIVVADFDRDGRSDVALRMDGRTQLWLQEAGGTWTEVQLTHPAHEGMEAGDLDMDGDPDLILNGYWFETPDTPAAARIAAGYAYHVIDPAWFNQAGNWTKNSCKVVVGDFDGDGRNDVAFSHSERAGHAVAWYGSATPRVDDAWNKHTVAVVDFCHTLQAADFDLDGAVDLLVGGMIQSQHRGLRLMLNAGGGASWIPLIIQTDGSYSAELGDIDNDGDPDIVGIRNWNSAPTWIYRNDRTRPGTTSAPVEVPVRQVPSPARAAPSDSPFPVRVSTNGRYLEDARGRPFLLHGDTAWSLIVQLTKDEAQEYLENRRQRGFNAILVNLIEYFYADDPPRNRYGDAPFTTPGDFSTPNEAYFAHADWVIEKAGEKGILVVLNPCYTGWGSSNTDGWVQEIVANGPTKCRDYGRYVGHRYQGCANIIWQAGGDQTIKPGSALERNWLEILRGIQDHAPTHLWTAHWYRFTTALDQGTFAPYMSLDNAYGGNRSYIQTLRAYNRADSRPTYVNEAYYEDTHLVAGAGTPPLLRAQAYWALLSGATGHLFGSDHVWAFGARVSGSPNAPRYDWRTGMDRQGSREMVYVKRLFEGRAWYDLAPDQDHSVVTSGYGTFGRDDRTAGGDYVTAARAGDGSLVMAYVASTGTGARTIAVNMASLRGAAGARWYNPTNGTSTSITGSPLANSGSRDFTTPGDNGTGTNDWVLILETARGGNFTSGTRPARKFGVHEIVLTGNGSVANPFDTLVTVRFTPPSGAANAKTVWAFHDGENTWRARVYLGETGEWTWSSTCESDERLHGRSGTFCCEPSALRGRLLVHPENPHQWMTEDGRWFLNLNDTAYFWLCAYDAVGKPVTNKDAQDYVRDAADQGITSLRSFLAMGPAGFLESRRNLHDPWRDAYFADEAMSRLRLAHFQTADNRLRWLLDEYPDIYMQIVLFPMGCHYAKDQVVWQTFSPQQKERLLRHIIARYAAYPQVFWLVVNDVHYGPNYPLNYAFAREVGEYFGRHDLWRHPLSTGHARRVDFAFPDDEWVTYLHLEHAHDLGATLAAKYAPHGKPVFLGEDRYEQDHGTRLDPAHMTYWQRRLFWSWLLAGGSTNYGGRWWTVHPYRQTGNRPTFRPTKPDLPFTAALTGLDSVRPIRDYFEQRRIELSDFQPNDALVKDAAGAAGVRAPKLMSRGRQEFLIYHPHAAQDDQHARPLDSQAAALAVDLRDATGTFLVEWYRAADGVAQTGVPISGGDWRYLTAPWQGHDCVVRLLVLEPTTSPLPRRDAGPSSAESGLPAQHAAGPLRVHPTNRRYFTDGTRNADGSLKAIDTVGAFDNVIYEISNESHGDSTAWQYEMIRFIKATEAKRPKRHPVWMSFQWL